VTTRKTNHFNNALGNFNYRTLKTELFWGYSEVGIEGKTFLLAEPEKALLDYLYLNTELATDADFSELRFNFDEFKTIFSEEKLRKYLGLYGNNCLNDRVEKFLNYYQNA
jgi:hypothetical protein